MPITPTSSISKNYQALGIDEIANDIETVFNAVNSLETTVNALPAAPTTTVVNISSDQIKAGGNIVLKTGQAANEYYDIEKVILEPSGVTPYTFSSPSGWLTLYCGADISSVPQSAVNEYGGVVFLDGRNTATNSDPANDRNYGSARSVNGDIVLYFDNTLTLGDGTMRAIITYTTRTFGA